MLALLLKTKTHKGSRGFKPKSLLPQTKTPDSDIGESDDGKSCHSVPPPLPSNSALPHTSSNSTLTGKSFEIGILVFLMISALQSPCIRADKAFSIGSIENRGVDKLNLTNLLPLSLTKINYQAPQGTTEKENLDKLYAFVHKALTESPLIDGHNDLPWNLRQFLHGQLQDFDFNSDLRSVPPWSKSAWSQTDLPRLRQGRVGGQLWVAYAPCQAQHLNAVQITLEQIDLIRRLIAKYPESLALALTPDDIERAHKDGKIASLIAVEGGHSIGNSLAVLRAFYDAGVRSLTLSHNCNSPWADSSIVETKGHKPQHGGLTEFGRTVVREMNRLGMVVDLSHSSSLTMRDTLKVSKAPVIFSHSSAYALCNSSRNVPDDILKELVWNRGIVMVTFYNFFVKCQPVATVRDVAKHINYIRGKIGIDHIGIGGDFDGINRTPEGLEDVSKYPNLFVELCRYSNWSLDELKNVAGRNFLRVFREVEYVGNALSSSGASASEELISPLFLEAFSKCNSNVSTSAIN